MTQNWLEHIWGPWRGSERYLRWVSRNVYGGGKYLVFLTTLFSFLWKVSTQSCRMTALTYVSVPSQMLVHKPEGHHGCNYCKETGDDPANLVSLRLKVLHGMSENRTWCATWFVNCMPSKSQREEMTYFGEQSCHSVSRMALPLQQFLCGTSPWP